MISLTAAALSVALALALALPAALTVSTLLFHQTAHFPKIPAHPLARSHCKRNKSQPAAIVLQSGCCLEISFS